MQSLINFLYSNRVKSFLWRSGMMILAYICATVAGNLGMLDLSATSVTVIGLILGEVSKAINSKIA